VQEIASSLGVVGGTCAAPQLGERGDELQKGTRYILSPSSSAFDDASHRLALLTAPAGACPRGMRRRTAPADFFAAAGTARAVAVRGMAGLVYSARNRKV
jgi:hypothetical protein